jgi:hypothetical protein
MKKNYFKSLAQVAILLCAPLFIASCDEFGTEDNPAGAYPSINTAAVTIDLKYGVDPTYKRTAIAASAATIEYSSSDEKVATVDETGVVTGVGAGTCDIIAKPYFIKNGSKLYTNEEVKYPVTVNDWRANVKFDKPEALVNSADIDDAEFKLINSVYPAGANVTYSHALPTGVTDPDPVGGIDNSTGVITLSAKNGVSVITATINSVPTGYEMNSFGDGTKVEATFTLTVKEGIAYVSGYDAEGDPIRTTMFLKGEDGKDQYTKINNTVITAFNAAAAVDVSLDGGIYYVDATSGVPLNKNITLKGDATFILADGSNFDINAAVMDDTPDTHTINIYGQKLQSGILHPHGTAGDIILDFKEINVYGGMLWPRCGSDGSGALNKISSVNIYKGGTLYAEHNMNYGYGIKMNTGGKVTVDGGTLEVVGKGSNADASYALIGDVVVKNKGILKASSASYRAISGTVTATTAMACDDTTWTPTATGYDGTWAAFTSTTSKKYVWAK